MKCDFSELHKSILIMNCIKTASRVERSKLDMFFMPEHFSWVLRTFMVPETQWESDKSENRLSLLNAGGFEIIFTMRKDS